MTLERRKGEPFITILTLVILSILTLALPVYDPSVYGSLYQWLDAITIIALAVGTVVLIVWGARLPIERKLEERGWYLRQGVLPIVFVFVAVGVGIVPLETVKAVIFDKADIILLIFAFAVASHGIARSGLVEYLAFELAKRCNRNTDRLILYLFILSSILTFVTSNDIVVLVMTPIILSICAQTDIRNAKLLLLSQFVAANTLSMGSLIGSPTNIILSAALGDTAETALPGESDASVFTEWLLNTSGETFGYGFLEYLFIMIVPAMICFFVSLYLVYWINNRSRSKAGQANAFIPFSWGNYQDSYRPTLKSSKTYLSTEMKWWVAIFMGGIGVLIVVSLLDLGLSIVTLTLLLASVLRLFAMKDESSKERDKALQANDLFHAVPFSLLGFGLALFVLTEALSTQGPVVQMSEFVFAELSTNPPWMSGAAIFVSGILVNVFNDLPAASLLGELLTQYPEANLEYTKTLLVQSLLVGLNVACYLTPAGALAGLIWFSVMRREVQSLRDQAVSEGRLTPDDKYIEIPTAGNLLVYGLVHFLCVTVVMAIVLPLLNMLVRIAVAPPNLEVLSLLGLSGMEFSIFLALNFGLLLFIYSRLRQAMRQKKVFISFFRDLLGPLTRYAKWASTHRGFHIGIVLFGLLAGLGWSIYLLEDQHDQIVCAASDLRPTCLYDQGGDDDIDVLEDYLGFFVWMTSFVPSGYEQEMYPQSTLGKILAAFLPVVPLAALFFIFKSSSVDALASLRRRLARGELPSHRIVMVNHQDRFEGFVRNMISSNDTFVLLLCEKSEYARAVAFRDSLIQSKEGINKIEASLKDDDPYTVFREFFISQTDEIYLLSDMSLETEYENVRFLKKLEMELAQNLPASEEDFAAFMTAGALDSVIPRILVESTSQRFSDLVGISLSERFLAVINIVNRFTDMGSYIRSDAICDSATLNEHFFVDRHIAGERAGKRPDEGFGYLDLSPYQRRALQAFYRKTFEKSRRISSFHAHDVLQARQELQSKIHEVFSGQGEAHSPIDAAQIVGIVCHAGSRHVQLSLSSSIAAQQSQTVEGLILRNSGQGTQPIENRAQGGRIYVVNVSLSSVAFIETLEMQPHSRVADKIIVCQVGDHATGYPLQEKDWIEVCRFINIDALLAALMGLDTSRSDMQLRRSDAIYAFIDYEKIHKPELELIRFLEGLNAYIKRLSEHGLQSQMMGDEDRHITHNNIYVALESNSDETRFVFETLSVDKIIDTSRVRTSYFENFSNLFRINPQTSEPYRHHELTPRRFKHAFDLANLLSRFFVERVHDWEAQNTELSSLEGLEPADAANLLREFAPAPLQFLGFISFEKLSIEHFERLDTDTTLLSLLISSSDQNRTLHRNDLIVFIPSM